jgi:hypothetical protein
MLRVLDVFFDSPFGCPDALAVAVAQKPSVDADDGRQHGLLNITYHVPTA